MDGEFYNSRELRTELKELGEDLETDGDAELAGRMYLHYGPEFVKQLNGDVYKRQLLHRHGSILSRDVT